jgi:hypothetical protein
MPGNGKRMTEEELLQQVRVARFKMDEARREMMKDLRDDGKYEVFKAAYELFLDLSGKWLNEVGKRQAAFDSWLFK